jgi:hypothetical protein
MSDAVSVAAQTRAPVIGALTAIDKALSMGLPRSQAVTVRGAGETQRYGGFTVQAILAQHSTLSPTVLGAFQTAITAAIGAPTPEESAAEAAILARGTFDPRVITEGTIAYLFTFDNGFRLIYRNSAGPITETERGCICRRITTKSPAPSSISAPSRSSWRSATRCRTPDRCRRFTASRYASMSTGTGASRFAMTCRTCGRTCGTCSCVTCAGFSGSGLACTFNPGRRSRPGVKLGPGHCLSPVQPGLRLCQPF